MATVGVKGLIRGGLGRHVRCCMWIFNPQVEGWGETCDDASVTRQHVRIPKGRYRLTELRLRIYRLQRLANEWVACECKICWGVDLGYWTTIYHSVHHVRPSTDVRRRHVTPLLRDNLHWLRVRERILFKLCLMVYRALSGLAPSYITELCVPVASILPGLHYGQLLMAHCSSRALVWNSASARSPSPPQLLGTVFLTTSGARQHLTNLNSAWKPIFLYSHITHSLVSVELSRTTFPLCQSL